MSKLFNVPLKAKAEVIQQLTDYFAPAIAIRPSTDRNANFKGKNWNCGVRLRDLYNVEYSPGASVLQIAHESIHALLGRTLWDPERDGNEVQKWMSDQLPNSGHPFLPFEEIGNCHFGYALQCHLDIILECVEYDHCDWESSLQRLQMIKSPEYFVKENYPCLSVKPLRRYLRDSESTEFYMNTDVDFHSLYSMQKLRDGKVFPEGRYFEESIDLDVFKEKIKTSPMVKTFGTGFFQLLGIIDKDMTLLGHISAVAVKENMDDLQKMFRIPDVHKSLFEQFWTSGLSR